MSHDGAEVVPGLWVGSLAFAQDNLCLEALGIVRVLTFGSRLNPSLEWRADAKLSNRAYDIEDHPCADLLAVLPSAMREIDKIMKSRQEKFGDVGDEKFEAKPKRGSGKEQAKGSEPQEPRLPAVLVHCASGISRSVAVCTAWLMLRQALELQEALQRVKKARPQALPNHGFVQCLQILEDEKGDLQAASKRWQKSNDISQNSRTRMVSKLRRKADDTAARAAKLEEELQGAQKGLDSPEGLAQLQLTVRRLRKLRKDIEQQRPRNTIDDAVASSVRKNTAEKVCHLLSIWEPKLPLEEKQDGDTVSSEEWSHMEPSPVDSPAELAGASLLNPKHLHVVRTIPCVRIVVSL